MKKGWQTKSLGDLCEIELGKTPARANASFWDEKRETSNVWLSIADLLKAEDNVVVDSKEYVSDKGAAICKLVPKGTLLVSFKLTLGRLAFAGRDLFTNEAIAALTIFNERELSKEFLFYCLTFFDWVKAAENDVKLKGMTLNKAKLKVMPVSFPPLAEQQRIVGLLDEAFEGLATAKANAEKNLQNARALFESHLQSVFTQRGPGWVEKRLADVADFKNGLNFTRQSNGQTLRMVGVGDFQEHSVVPIKTIQSVTIDGKLSDDYLIRRDDILTVRSNGSKDLVGRCMLVPDVDGMTSFSGFIIRIRFDTRALSPRFLLHFMKSSATRDRLTRDGGGANISNINQAKLSELPVSLPSFKQQEEIANRLDDLREETQRLARLYERKHAALDALKKSLLHQAFSGAL
jgi:type I restriction enzyme S subunit